MTTVQRETTYEWPVDHETYHRDTSKIGNSSKEVYRRSPRLFDQLFVAKTRERPAPTKDLRIGTYTHALTLEPAQAASGFVTMIETFSDGTDLGQSKAHKEYKAAWLLDQAAAGRTVVNADEWRLAVELREAVMGNLIARRFLEAEGHVEHSIVWTDAETGLTLKSRRDKWNVRPNQIINLKTSRATGPEALSRECLNLGYHRTAEFYIAGGHEFAGDVPVHIIIAVSKPTLEVVTFEFAPEALALAYEQNRKTLREMKLSFETGIFSAEHEKQILTLALPRYGMSSAEWEVESGDSN